MEPTSAPRRAALVAVIVIAVVIALGAFLALYKPAADAIGGIFAPVVSKVRMQWSLMSMPEELRTAYLQTAEGTFKAGPSGLVAAERPLPAELERVYAREFNTGTEKANGRVSPDAEHVVFQTLVDSSPEEMMLGGWQVSVAETEASSQYVLGRGILPFFLDSTHVAWVAKDGIRMADISTPTASSTLLFAHDFSDANVVLSPERSAFAYVNDEGVVEVRYATAEGTQVQTVLGGPFTSFALSETALYLLNALPEGTTVDRFRLAENEVSERIYTFPADLGVTALSF